MTASVVPELLTRFLVECQERLTGARLFVIVLSGTDAVQVMRVNTGSWDLQPLVDSSDGGVMMLPVVLVGVDPEAGRTVVARIDSEGLRTLQ